MKKLIASALVLSSGVVGATCQDVFNAPEGKWEYVCTPQPSDPRAPICHQEYDAINAVWVTVCN